MIEFKEIMDNKKKYLPLLLIADEQESAIDAYLERGRLYVMEDGGVRAVCVVTTRERACWKLKIWPSPRRGSAADTGGPLSNISGGAIGAPFIRCRSALATAP